MRHFYHVFCGAPWEAIAAEHVRSLTGQGLPWEITVGLIGPARERQRALTWWAARFPDASFIQRDSGYEQVTLRELHRWAKTASPGAPVLYAHTKGVTHKNCGGVHGMAWRRSMTGRLIGNWRECLRLLEDHDAVGCHWLAPGDDVPIAIGSPFFGGNFWWSKAGYVARLPGVGDETRYDAEGWIGLGNPRVADLRPGYPDLNHYRLEMMTIMNPGVLDREGSVPMLVSPHL